MFSLAFADLLVGIVFIPQVIHEDWIQKGAAHEFDKTTCRHLNSKFSIVSNSKHAFFDEIRSLQASLWHDLAQCDHLHLHLHHDLHHKVRHGHQ